MDSDRTCTQVRFLNLTDSFLNAMLVFSFDGILLVLTDNLVKWFYLFLEEWLAKYYWIVGADCRNLNYYDAATP